MSKLFIELYLDEDVDILVAELLTRRGYTVMTARGSGTLGQADDAQLDFAVRQGCALLTHNRSDFEELALAYFAQNQPHYGIILAVRRTPHEIVQRLIKLLNDVTAEEFQNQVYYL